MAYKKAKDILPKKLIFELQTYIQGEMVYIPKKKDNYHKWGTCTGGRELLDQRNEAIQKAYQSGDSITELSETYCLAVETVRKIVYLK